MDAKNGRYGLSRKIKLYRWRDLRDLNIEAAFADIGLEHDIANHAQTFGQVYAMAAKFGQHMGF